MAIKPDKTEFEYVIPLRTAWKRVPRYKRANKAIKEIKEFLVRHMKIRDGDLNKIKVSKYINEFVWSRGIKKPPIKIKVFAKKKGENIEVELVNFTDKLKFKKIREEKRSAEAKQHLVKKKSLMEKAKEGIQKPTEEAETPETEAIKESKKEEEQEKKAAVVEAGAKMEKAAAKKTKHQTKTSKAPKRQQRKALAK
jgi:large subunit ribosomal protein L31e